MNLKSTLLILLAACFPYLNLCGQKSEYKVRTIAFYNLENLFDTIDDPGVFDEDFIPRGKYRWNTERYNNKLQNMAEVISGIGAITRKGPPDIVGVCEVENLTVLRDLVNHEKLIPYNFGIIHRDGPDERGIDVAILYRTESFYPVSFQWHRLKIRNKERYWENTRNQLVVHGYMDGLPLYLIVNHWPSRRGGELLSRPYRVAAAELNIKIIDSILRINPEPMIIAMGDFNDNPTDYTIRKVLKTKKNKEGLGDFDLYNPMASLFRKGKGSLAYRDSWSLFDQIYISGNLMNGKKQIQLWKAGIHDPPHLLQRQGNFKGYPLRTFSSGRYTGGYSDHLPVYAHFIKEIKPLLGNN